MGALMIQEYAGDADSDVMSAHLSRLERRASNRWLMLAADVRRSARVRLLLLSWFGVFFLLYCFYGPYETWWYTRYLLPGIPALSIGMAMVAEDLVAVVRARAALPARRL